VYGLVRWCSRIVVRKGPACAISSRRGETHRERSPGTWGELDGAGGSS
jgi:hypothetical protein